MATTFPSKANANCSLTVDMWEIQCREHFSGQELRQHDKVQLHRWAEGRCNFTRVYARSIVSRNDMASCSSKKIFKGARAAVVKVVG